MGCGPGQGHGGGGEEAVGVRALLLAAGRGTRLWPLTTVRAKPAMPFLGIPLVRRLASRLLEAGVEALAVNLHHLPQTVCEAMRGLPVVFSWEETPLGTSGALRPLEGFLRGHWFWTVNAKIHMDPFPPPVPQRGACLTAVLVPAPAKAPYTRVDTVDGKVVGFSSPDTHDGTGLLFSGVQVVGPQVWEFLPEGFSHFTTDVYPRMWASGKVVSAWVFHGSWLEFSTPSRYLEHHLRTGPGPWRGEGGYVAPSARVTESVLWDGVVVEAGARLHRCIVADGVRIPQGRSLDRAAIVPVASAGEDPRGQVVDDNLVVPLTP